MSLNRQRNIYTLRDYHLPSPFLAKEIFKRRQTADPFERDPFKIQSYNFRYADRPSLPVTTLQPKITNHDSFRDCKTYFYNHDFPSTNDSNTPRSFKIQNPERDLNLTKFQEYRRRKFLHETGPYRKLHLTATKENSYNTLQKPYDSKILNSYYGSHNVKPLPLTSLMKSSNSAASSQNGKSYYFSTCNQNFNMRQNSSQLLVNNTKPDALKRSPTPSATSKVHQSLASTSKSNSASRRRSLSSGCEININIKSLEDNSLQENVNIKIETDSPSTDIYVPWHKSINNLSHRNNDSRENLNYLNNLDKKLSKFQNKQDTQSENRIADKDRIKDLTSIYSSQILNKSATNRRQVKSVERLPSLIPFRSNDTREGYQASLNSKENLTSKKSILHRVKDNLSIYDNKAAVKNSSHNNLHQSPYLRANEGSKILNSSYVKARSSCSKKFNNARQASLNSSLHLSPSTPKRSEFKATVPLRLRSNTKLPLNLNINVFADKLKLLKV